MISRIFIVIACMSLPSVSFAETVVASRTLRAQTIVTAGDLALIEDNIPGMRNSIEQAIGLETKAILYAGRPIAIGDLGPAAIVERNQIIALVYKKYGLTIRADGRSLERAGPGEIVRVMNLSSKTTLSGVVAPDGSVHVGGMNN